MDEALLPLGGLYGRFICFWRITFRSGNAAFDRILYFVHSGITAI